MIHTVEMDMGPGQPPVLWYLICVHYPTALQAKTAWERAERKLELSSGAGRGIGVLRFTATEPGEPRLVTGCPHGVHPVAAVTHHEPTARKAQRLLADGTPWEPTDDFEVAMIARRTRVVTEANAAGNRQGRLVTRRPEGRGATLLASGKAIEPPPPRG